MLYTISTGGPIFSRSTRPKPIHISLANTMCRVIHSKTHRNNTILHSPRSTLPIPTRHLFILRIQTPLRTPARNSLARRVLGWIPNPNTSNTRLAIKSLFLPPIRPRSNVVLLIHPTRHLPPLLRDHPIPHLANMCVLIKVAARPSNVRATGTVTNEDTKAMSMCARRVDLSTSGATRSRGTS